MNEPGLCAACPWCGALARHAMVPVPLADPPAASSGPEAAPPAPARQRLVCTRCEKLWEGAMVPLEQLAQLQLAAENLVAARRQIAMMRLILSKDQLARLEQAGNAPIRLHRAA